MMRLLKSNSPSRALIVLCLIALLSGSGSSVARAADPPALRIPGSAIAAARIANTATFWRKFHALPLIGALDAYLQNPTITSNLKYQQFQLERAKLAHALGYPVTFEEILGEVFGSAVCYLVAGDGAGPAGVMILSIKDEDKAATLLQALDKKNQQAAAEATIAAAPSASSSTSNSLALSTPSPSLFIFDHIDIDGTQVSHWRAIQSPFKKVTEGYYTINDNRLVVSNALAPLKEALGEAVAASASLMRNPDFERLIKVLPLADADMIAWFDGDRLFEGGPMGALMSNIPGKYSSNKSAFTVSFGLGGITSKLATTADPETLSPNFKPAELISLSLTAQRPLFVFASALDGQLIYKELQTMFSMAGMFGMMGGMGGSGQSPLDQLEQSTGISIQKDLLPALGHEAFYALNSLTPDPSGMPIPKIDLMMGVGVRDPEAMANVMQKLEAVLESRMNGPMTASGDGSPRFQTIDTHQGPVRSLPLGMPGVNFCYNLTKDFVVVGLNSDAVAAALKRRASGVGSLKQSSVYNELSTRIKTQQIYNFGLVDIDQLVRWFTPYLPILGYQFSQINTTQLMTLSNQVLSHLGSAAAISAREDGIAVSFMKISMQ